MPVLLRSLLVLRPVLVLRPLMVRAALIVPRPLRMLPSGRVVRRLPVRLRRVRVVLPARVLRVVLPGLPLVRGPAARPAAAAAALSLALLRMGALPWLRLAACRTAVRIPALHAPRRQVRGLRDRAAARLVLAAFKHAPAEGAVTVVTLDRDFLEYHRRCSSSRPFFSSPCTRATSSLSAPRDPRARELMFPGPSIGPHTATLGGIVAHERRQSKPRGEGRKARCRPRVSGSGLQPQA